MKIAVLFDGAGLARLGLEQAGHDCIGYELDPWKVHLGKMVGSGNVFLADATAISLRSFDAVWASPPCASRSSNIKDLTGKGGLRNASFQNDLLFWCLDHLKDQARPKISWIENVTIQGSSHGKNDWGIAYNAAQFQKIPLQCRNRIIGGNHAMPRTFREYRRSYPSLQLCPTISATEYKGCGSDRCRASRFYGRKLTVQECAYHQGFKIPQGWRNIPPGFTPCQWERKLYEAIGDGVPVYMAKAFGAVYR